MLPQVQENFSSSEILLNFVVDQDACQKPSLSTILLKNFRSVSHGFTSFDCRLLFADGRYDEKTRRVLLLLVCLAPADVSVEQKFPGEAVWDVMPGVPRRMVTQ